VTRAIHLKAKYGGTTYLGEADNFSSLNIDVEMLGPNLGSRAKK